MRKLYHLLLLLLFGFSVSSFAQVKYGISTTLGKSMFLKVYNVPQATTGDEQSALTNWSIGAFVKVPLWKTPFSIRQEIGFRPINSLDEFEKSSPEYWKRTIKMNTFFLPLSLEYNCLPWLSVHGGLSYSYNLNLKGEPYYNFYKHTWGYQGGFDFLIRDHISLGGFYYKSFGNYHGSYSKYVDYKGLNYGIRLAYTIN